MIGGTKTADLSGDACHGDQEVRGGGTRACLWKTETWWGMRVGGPGPVVAKGTHAEPIRLSLQ